MSHMDSGDNPDHVETFVRFRFPGSQVTEQLQTGWFRQFGRTDFNPPDDESIPRDCGEIRVIAQGALIAALPEAKASIWIATSKGRRIEITSAHPVLVTDEAYVCVETKSGDQAGHQFHVAVSLADDNPHAGFNENVPDHRSTGRLGPLTPTRPVTDLKLSSRQRDAMAALTIDYPLNHVRPLMRSTLAAALPGRQPPLSGPQIEEAVKEVAATVEREGWTALPKGQGRRQALCDWLHHRDVIGPADWDRVRLWLR